MQIHAGSVQTRRAEADASGSRENSNGKEEEIWRLQANHRAVSEQQYSKWKGQEQSRWNRDLVTNISHNL